MYKPYISNETLLFPPNLGDFIPSDAPARLISDIVDVMDLKEIHDSYSEASDGQPPYHPAMLLKAVLFGYMNNIYSTRGLESAMTRDAHLIWLSSYQFPDHTTISRFKTRCMPYIKVMFSRLVRILAERGEIELTEDLYIDGTTIRSRAARRRIRWRSNAERFGASADADIQQGVKALLEQVENGDSTGDGNTGHVTYTKEEAREIADRIGRKAEKEGLKKVRGRITAIRNACDRKDAHDRTLEQCAGRCGVAPTDPDCGIMHAKEDGYKGAATPNYNVQIATKNQYVTNFGAYDQPSDKSIAMDFVDTCIEENGVRPSTVVGDAGYGCEEVYVGLEKRQIEAVVKYPGYDAEAGRRPVKGDLYDKSGFRLSPDESTLICPAGHTMRVIRVEEAYTSSGFRSDGTVMTCDHCGGCPFREKCSLIKSRRMELHRKLGNFKEERKAKARLDLPANQEKLKRRAREPEPVFGQLKHNHGYTRFRHFSIARVTMDLGFVFMALNILKLHKNIQKSA